MKNENEEKKHDVPRPHRGEDPTPDGADREPVGEDEDGMTDEATGRVAEKPAAPDGGLGPPVSTHDTPDGNPIDPRVF